MELTQNQKRKLEKFAKFSEDEIVATINEFSEIEDRLVEINNKIDNGIEELKEEVKKKSLELSVLEIDRDELRGEDGFDGDDGEDYILTEQDLEDIAKKVKVPVVEKVIEKTEVIRETPIITNEIKEVALHDTSEDIRNKLELLDGDERLEFKAIKQSDEILKDIKELKSRPNPQSWGRGGGGGNIEVFEEGVKRGSGSAINFGAGFDVSHDGHKATVNLDTTEKKFDYIEFNTSYTPTGSEPTGTTYWDADNHSLSTVYENGAILQHGFELYTFGTDEGNNFPEGSAVSVKGSTGNRVAFELTDLSDTESVDNYIGLLTTPVDSGNRIATREGAVRGINTTGTPQGETWAEGDWLYVGQTSGSLTNVEPTGSRVIRVGIITNRHQNQGVIELDRLIEPITESSFESYNKNLRAYPYTITETSPTITTLAYNTGSGTITKTITDVSSTQTTIAISGIGTKTITETSPTLTTIVYS